MTSERLQKAREIVKQRQQDKASSNVTANSPSSERLVKARQIVRLGHNGFVLPTVGELDSMAGLYNYMNQNKEIPHPEIVAQKAREKALNDLPAEQQVSLAEENLDKAKEKYKNASQGWGAASMSAKGGWVGNYLRDKAGARQQDFDWQQLNQAINEKYAAEDYLSATKALQEQHEFNAIINSYDGLSNEEKVARARQEKQAAEHEYNEQLRLKAISARSGKGGNQDMVAAREKKDLAKQVLTYFEDQQWFDNSAVEKAKLEAKAQGSADYEQRLAEAKKALASWPDDEIVGELFNMTAEEIATRAVLSKIDKAGAQIYGKIIQYDINARTAAEQEERLANSGKGTNFAAYLGSFTAAPAGILNTAYEAIRKWITGEHRPIDLNSDAYIGARTQALAQENLTGDIEDPMLKFLADTGLSLSSYLTKLPFGPTGALLALSTESANATMYDSLQRGASSSQAFWNGMLAGTIDGLTEKLPMERLFRLAKSGGKFFSKQGIINIAKQAGIEMTEEAASAYLTTLSDIAMMGSKSSFMQTMNAYIDDGMSRADAYRQAIEDHFIIEPMLSAFGGAISGGLFGSGAVAISNISDFRQNRAKKKADKNAAELQAQRNGADSIADNDLVLPTADTPAMSGREYKQRQEAQNRAANMTSAAEAVSTQPRPVTNADIERANQLIEREMAEEQAEEEALSPDNFLTGELAERAAGSIIRNNDSSAYDIGEEIGDVGFGEGAIDNLPEQDLAARFRTGRQISPAIITPNESAKIKMLRNQLRNKGISNIRIEQLPQGERGYYDPDSGEIVLSAGLEDNEAFNFVMGHEIVHHAARADEDLVDDIIASMRIGGVDVDGLIAEVLARYRRHAERSGRGLNRIDDRYAMEEVVADYIGEICRNEQYLEQLAEKEPNLLVRIIRVLRDLIENLGNSRTEINKAREYEGIIHRVQHALAKAGHEEMLDGERRYSIKRTRTMPYKEQVAGYFNNNGVIRSSDSLYLGDSGPMLSKYGIESSPLYIPTSVINKAIRSIKGSKNGHNLTKSDILELQDGIKNAVAIIYNPSRNALVYVTENQDTAGNYIVATFDLNNDLYGENAHKATSIHGRENLAVMLERLGEDATVFVQNENKLNQMLPGNQILTSLELLAKVELDTASISRNDTEVNRLYSLAEENDPDLQRAIQMQQEGYSSNEIFNETGKVVMAGGDIYSGIGGVLQYSPNKTKEGDIGGRREQESGREGAYSGRADNQDEAGQGLGEESGRPRNDDRQRNRTDGGRVREEARGWEELSGDERQGGDTGGRNNQRENDRIANTSEGQRDKTRVSGSDGRRDTGRSGQVGETEARGWENLRQDEQRGLVNILESYIQADNNTEINLLLEYYKGATREEKITALCQDIYNDVVISPIEAEQKYGGLIHNIGSLISEFGTAIEDTGRRYSLEEDSEGDGRRYSLTEEETNQQEQQNPRTMSKAERYLNRQINAAVQKIADILSVPNSSRRNELKPFLQKLADEYKANGRISNESINEVFNQAYDMGLVIQDDFYNEYRDLKNILRDTKITISPEDAANIPDYSLWRRRQFGKLRISNKVTDVTELYPEMFGEYPTTSTKPIASNKDGVPVGSFYRELVELYPELFDPELTAPSEQLQRMAEVADQISIVKQTLDNAYGDDAENFKIFARQEFQNEIDDFIDELAIVSRYEQEKAEQKSVAEQSSAPRSEATMAKVYKEFKAARRKVDKAVAKYLLTEADNKAIEGLLKGFYTKDNLPDGINKKAVLEVYDAKRAYEELAAIIDENNKAIKNARLAIVKRLLETSDDWTDKKTGFAYSRETMERNIRDIVPDKKEAKKIIDELFAPVHANEAARTRLKNEYRDRVRKLNISQKVAKGNKVSEAYAVQFLGEANSAMAYLQDKRPDLREGGLTYGEWQTARNEFLAENPNLDMPKIERAIEEFRAIYNELFEMVNQVRLRNGYTPVDYRRGYFPHFTETGSDTIFGKMAQALGINMDVTDLPTDINGLTHTFRPGIRWEGHLLQRIGNETAYNALQGFDKYIEGVSDIIFHTDDIQRLRAFASTIRYKYSREGIRAKVDEIRESNLSPEEKDSLIAEAWGTDRTALSNLVVEIEEYTNLLANKKAFDDRNMERKINRKMYNIAKALENRVAANMIAINPGSWLTNFIPIAQGVATLKNGALLRGMWDTIRSYKADDGFWQSSDFLTNRRGSELLSLTAVQKAGRIAGKGMELIDQFTADTLVRARYYQNMQEGVSQAEALAEADAWAASVIADRSKGALPTFFEAKNPFRKLFTMFQVEVNNQLSFLFKDLPAEARKRGIAAVALALLKYALAAYIFDDLYELLVGRRPALDPLNMLNEAVGDLTGYELPNTFSLITDAVSGNEIDFTTEQEGLSEAGLNLIENVGENIPFVGGVFFDGGRIPISSALPNIENIWKAGSGLITGEMNDDKAWATIGKELMAPAVYLVPPFGGGAIKKAVQGIEAVARSGSYTIDTDGNDILQYPVYNDGTLQTIGNYARAAVFGKTSLPTGAEWIEEGFKNLSAKESAAYKELIIGGSNSEDVYETLRAMKAEKKSIDKRLELMDASLSDYEKLTIYETVLYDEEDSRPEDIENIMAAGVSFDDAMRIQNKYDFLNDIDDMTAKEKAGEFAYWLDSNDFTEDQQAAAREAFKFYSTIEAKPGEINYDKMTAAGLDEDVAHEVELALSSLTPLTGEDEVLDTQKYRAIADLDISDNDKLKAFKGIMNESSYKKISTGYDNGVKPDDYITFREYLDEESEGDNATQAEAVKALNRMTWLSTSEKAVLYQLANSGWSPRNNPYSATVGAKVYYAMK